ncbi:MAG: DUF885 domain-containing protein [Thermoanaerobaculia bacterium]|nr:DUF885 domain-containing protein [Thermoanaerobaculia bacterium]
MSRRKKIVYGSLALLLVTVGTFLIPTLWFKPWLIEHFYARTFAHFVLEHPMILSSMRILEPMGIELHNDDLDDVSVEAEREEAAWLDRQLEILRSYERSELDDALSYDVLEWFLADMQRMNRFLLHDYPVNQFGGLQSSLPDFMINIHQIRDEGDAEDYVERLSKFDRFFGQVMDGLREQREAGIVPPRFVLEKVLVEMEAFVGDPVRENPLFTHFEGEVGALEGLDAEEKEELQASAIRELEETVYPTYRELIETVEELREVATTDDGVWKLPEGDEYYRVLLRHHTTTELTPDEVHRLGLAEVERNQAEMRRILEEEGYPVDDLGATLRALAEEERFLFPHTEEGDEQILAGYQEIIDEISVGLAPLFDLRPEAEVTVEPVPEFKEETSSTAYYRPPPFDRSKPGTFYVNLRNPDEHYRWGMRTLAFHEAIPGHHFQIALAMEMEDVPFFRRVIPFTAYVEGWAHYAERLAAEEGFQKDPYDRLGYLQAQLFRAVRLVVDTGIHDRRWAREEAIEYMRSNTGMPESDVVAEVERYIVMPGQACAYKVGQLKILELRERAREELGDAFDIREFHNVVLGNGALPLTLLEREVEDWIAESEPVRPAA